jgi:hypothetical protein
MHHRAAAPGLAHQRHAGAGGQHEGFQVDGKDLIPELQIHLERGSVAPEPKHPRDIGQIVDRPEAATSLGDARGDKAFVGQIALLVVQPRAMARKARGLGFEVKRGDACPRSQQCGGNRLAHAPARAGDDTMAPCEIVADHSGLPLLCCKPWSQDSGKAEASKP